MSAIRPAILALVLTLPAACGPGTQQGAGADLDEGAFGDPTRLNTLVQNGELTYADRLDQRFEAAVPTVVRFPFDSATLGPEARAILDRQADFIRQFPEVRFSVYGHTDLVGSDAYNTALGRRRAETVVGYLASRGVDRSRLAALVSYGERRPVVATSEPTIRNRRAVTEVAGFVARHPTVLDGKYAAVVYRDYVQSAATTDAGGSAGGGEDAN